jgi:hypothetical protein
MESRETCLNLPAHLTLTPQTLTVVEFTCTLNPNASNPNVVEFTCTPLPQ